MEKIKQLITAGGSTGQVLPETAFRAFNVLSSTQGVSSSGWNVGAGLLVARTGSAVTYAIVQGKTVSLAANTSAPALTGFNLTTGQFAAVLTTVDAGGTLRNYFTSIETVLNNLQYPRIPISEAVIGIVYFAPTTTFTGGTTALDAANVNATFASITEAAYPQNAV